MFVETPFLDRRFSFDFEYCYGGGFFSDALYPTMLLRSFVAHLFSVRGLWLSFRYSGIKTNVFDTGFELGSCVCP